MARWQTKFAVNHESNLAVFSQIAKAISDDIRRQRLKAGSPLPSSRKLAQDLGVHRNTVIAAYNELAAEGWIETRPAQGTFVSRELPERYPTPPKVGVSRASPHYALPPLAHAHRRSPPRGVLNLSGGMPDPRLLPTELLGRAMRRMLKLHGPKLMNYGDAQGYLPLREQMAEMLAATRGIAVTADEIMVTRGSQMGIYLVAEVLLRAGDRIAVEALGYGPAWDALKSTNAGLIGIELDSRGIKTRHLLRRMEEDEGVRAVYLTPHHQYPTTVALSAARRIRLLQLAKQGRMAIIEDDYDHEFHYEGRPVLPLASSDQGASVIYIGTLSKVVAPGLRLGYIAAPAAIIRRLKAARMRIDRQGDLASEAAIAELLEDGEIQRHANRMRRIYKGRRDHLVELLRREFANALEFTTPAGGLAIWAKVAADIDLVRWQQRSEERGVYFSIGKDFSLGRSAPQAVRIGFAAYSESDTKRAIGLIKRSL